MASSEDNEASKRHSVLGLVHFFEPEAVAGGEFEKPTCGQKPEGDSKFSLERERGEDMQHKKIRQKQQNQQQQQQEKEGQQQQLHKQQQQQQPQPQPGLFLELQQQLKIRSQQDNLQILQPQQQIQQQQAPKQRKQQQPQQQQKVQQPLQQKQGQQQQKETHQQEQIQQRLLGQSGQRPQGPSLPESMEHLQHRRSGLLAPSLLRPSILLPQQQQKPQPQQQLLQQQQHHHQQQQPQQQQQQQGRQQLEKQEQNDLTGNKNDEIQQLRKQNSNKNDEIQLLQRQNNRKDSQILRLQNENQNKNHEIRQLRNENNEKKQEIQQLRDENNDKNHDIQQLRDENSNQNHEIDQLRRNIRNITMSFMTEYGTVAVSDEKLGTGAWGSVFSGDFYGTKVAVKEYHQIILSSYNMDILLREISIAAQCRHPNLLQFICATQNKNQNLLIVTELMDVSLRWLIEERARARSKLVPQQLKSISLDVARGLNYLHSKKPNSIIHRDVSSANVLLWVENGIVRRAKISDYGSANLMQQCNTPNPGAAIYAAPEAARSRHDPKIDVFSYGILVCEMSICELPHPDERKNQINRISTYRIRELVESCTKTEPNKRPTMQEVIERWNNE